MRLINIYFFRTYLRVDSGHMDENERLRRCLEGHAEEYRFIMEKYQAKMMALAWNVLGNREDAEEACQDAFAQAFIHLDSFDLQRRFKDWLYTILMNRCRDQLRKKKRLNQFMSLRRTELVGGSGWSNPTKVSSKKLPENLLRNLNPKERIALALWANEGYSGEEIGDVLKCAAATARVHLFKARRKIKALLEHQNAENKVG